MSTYTSDQQRAIWRSYASAMSGATFYLDSGAGDETAAAVALGAAHRGGLPLTRPELLAEVARLCGEQGADADAPEEDDANAAWLKGYSAGEKAERNRLLVALEKWEGGEGDEDGLLKWIASQRKAGAS